MHDTPATRDTPLRSTHSTCHSILVRDTTHKYVATSSAYMRQDTPATFRTPFVCYLLSNWCGAAFV